jgi:3',5'-cyclic AMP phosphodiesterase CpdA
LINGKTDEICPLLSLTTQAARSELLDVTIKDWHFSPKLWTPGNEDAPTAKGRERIITKFMAIDANFFIGHLPGN